LKSYPIQNISNDGNKIYLFCREKDNSLKIIEDDSFLPYYFEPTTDEKSDAISIYEEPLKKICCNHPSDIKKQRSNSAYEADINYCKRYILDKILTFEKSNPRIIFLDIEVNCNELPHPKEDQKLDSPISIIRFYDNYTQKYYSWRLDQWKSEYEMLDNFCQTIKKLSPDIWCSWNVSFDYYALFYRIGEDFPKKISPINQTHWRHGDQMPAGISIIDLMGLYAKYTLHKKDSYALMNVANDELNYKIEEDFDFTDIEIANQKNKLDVQKMVELDQKLHLFEYFDEIRLLTRCYWEDLPSEMRNYSWQSNNSKVIDMLALAEARRLGVVLPSKRQDVKKDFEVEGAFRWLEQSGLYKDVADIDLSGAYPQAIIDFCLSPENICTKEEENTIKIDVLTRDTQEYKTTYYVKQNSGAILPSLVRKLLDLKNELKTKLKQTDKKDKDYKRLEIAYASRKALTNTAYGVILLMYFRLFDYRVGELTTFLVRDLLRYIQQKMKKHNQRVHYFDTDGFIKEGKEDNTKQLNDWVFEWAMDKYQNDKVNITFEYSGHYSTIFIQALCRYRGRLETNTGQKIETKGIQMKRKDTGEWVKLFQEKLYDKILDGESKETIIKFIEESIQQMKEEDVRKIALPVKINKKTEDYKTTPKWLKPLEETKKIVPDFAKSIGDRFYIIYCNSVEKLALGNKYYEHIKKENIDWKSMIEKNVLNILVPIFKGLNWETDLLDLAEKSEIILGSQYRNRLLEDLSNFEELKLYYSAREVKKRRKESKNRVKKIAKKLAKDDKSLNKIAQNFCKINNEFWVKNIETNKEYLVTRDAYEASKDILEIIESKKKSARKVRAKSKSAVTRKQVRDAVVLSKTRTLLSEQKVLEKVKRVIDKEAEVKKTVEKLNKVDDNVLYFEKKKTLDWD